MPPDSPEPQTLEIDPALDLAGASAAHAALSDRLTRLDPGRSVLLELGAGRPTAPAPQLAQATRLALRARGLAADLGPRAQAALGPPPTDG